MSPKKRDDVNILNIMNGIVVTQKRDGVTILNITHRTEDLAWPGTQKKKQKMCNETITSLDDATLLFAGWLLYVPATGSCISGTDLLRQFYVLPH